MIFHKKISKCCFGLALGFVGVLGFSGDVFSRPTLVEFFGQNSCLNDEKVQETLQDILQNEADVIVINCRTWLDDERTAKTFSRQFCNQRSEAYKQKFIVMDMYYNSPVIVNGRWDANYQDIMPAVKVGRTDNIESISLARKGDLLDISIPEMESSRGGNIILYAYAPTQGAESVYVDPDLSLTDEMKERISANKSVPFVTNKRTAPLYVRPVVAMEKLGHWNGTRLDMTISLSGLAPLVSSVASDLSYIVVLYEGSDVGPVLAVGEVISTEEYYNTLPHSFPKDIKYMSAPDALKR